MKKVFPIILICIILTSCFTKSKSQDINNSKEIFAVVNKKNDFLTELELYNYLKSAPTIKPVRNLESPFDTLMYDKVIVYDFDGRHGKNKVINNYGWFENTISKQQFLSQNQANKIIKSLCEKSSYGGNTAACFEPSFAIVFFKDAKMINQITICLDCNYLTSTIEIPAQYEKKVKIDSTFYPLIGFSKNGQKAITSLCKQLHFKYGNY